jgi:tetratricopeptide (TPR) repeat protein
MPDAVLAAEQLAFRYGAETGRWDAWTGDSEAIDWRDTTITLRARSMALSSAYQRAAAAILARRDTMPAHATARAFREAMATRRAGTPMMSGLAAMLDAMLQQQRGDRESAIGTLTSLRAAGRAARFGSMTPSSTLHVPEELGAALVAAGRAKEAVAVYEEALRDQPNRAAALLGLARAQAAAGDTTAARATQARLAATWKRADTAVRSTAALDAGR